MQDHASAHELRRDPRADVVLELRYRNEGHLLVSYCTNLSRGGLFIPSTHPLPPGTPIELRLTLPGETSVVTVQAEVRWTRYTGNDEGPAGMGLSFQAIDRLLGDRIDAIITTLVPLRVVILSDQEGLRAYVGAQIEGLLKCEVQCYGIDLRVVPSLAGSDLVILDLGSAHPQAIAVLETMAGLPVPPPWLVLSEPSPTIARLRAHRLGRLVYTPIDSEELRFAVLETLAHVRTRQVSTEEDPA